MTKRHFIALADAIRTHNTSSLKGKYAGTHHQFTDDQIEVLARFCGSQSSKFSESIWTGYAKGECGPSGGKK